MKDHFAMVAPFYDYFLGRRYPRYLAGLLKLPINGLLLDAGGGTGRISVHFRSLVKKVIVSDLSFPMLIQTQQKGGLFPVQAHAECLPFGSGMFDRIVVVDALHHFCDQEQAVRELIRILKPGGRMVIEEPDINLFSVKVVALAEKLFKMQSRFLSASEICRMISENGLNPRTEKTKNFRTWIVADK
ncbi:MAG: class I SAM-dependent methyltransferase [Desulfobacterales bacterium]